MGKRKPKKKSSEVCNMKRINSADQNNAKTRKQQLVKDTPTLRARQSCQGKKVTHKLQENSTTKATTRSKRISKSESTSCMATDAITVELLQLSKDTGRRNANRNNVERSILESTDPQATTTEEQTTGPQVQDSDRQIEKLISSSSEISPQNMLQNQNDVADHAKNEGKSFHTPSPRQETGIVEGEKEFPGVETTSWENENMSENLCATSSSCGTQVNSVIPGDNCMEESEICNNKKVKQLEDDASTLNINIENGDEIKLFEEVSVREIRSATSCTDQEQRKTAQLSQALLMKNLPYMGELTFDTRPRRGRKPKKADICHLIAKNYGIHFPSSYLSVPISSPSPRVSSPSTEVKCSLNLAGLASLPLSGLNDKVRAVSKCAKNKHYPAQPISVHPCHSLRSVSETFASGNSCSTLPSTARTATETSLPKSLRKSHDRQSLSSKRQPSRAVPAYSKPAATVSSIRSSSSFTPTIGIPLPYADFRPANNLTLPSGESLKMLLQLKGNQCTQSSKPLAMTFNQISSKFPEGSYSSDEEDWFERATARVKSQSTDEEPLNLCLRDKTLCVREPQKNDLQQPHSVVTWPNISIFPVSANFKSPRKSETITGKIGSCKYRNHAGKDALPILQRQLNKLSCGDLESNDPYLSMGRSKTKTTVNENADLVKFNIHLSGGRSKLSNCPSSASSARLKDIHDSEPKISCTPYKHKQSSGGNGGNSKHEQISAFSTANSPSANEMSPFDAHFHEEDVSPRNLIECKSSKYLSDTEQSLAKQKPQATSAEVSICKFKFTGGAKPSLQEKKMLSVDSTGHFRFYSDKGTVSSQNLKASCNGSHNAEAVQNPVKNAGRRKADNKRHRKSESSVPAASEGRSVRHSFPHETLQSAFSTYHPVPSYIQSTAGQSPSLSEDYDGSSSSGDETSGPFHVGQASMIPGLTSKPGKSHEFEPELSYGSKVFNAKRKKRKRKTRKSFMREKLEKTFKEKGFLIQTQQLESAEGATYCKFRQLRKFTRYLYRSWKDYLPGNLQSIGNANNINGSDNQPQPQHHFDTSAFVDISHSTDLEPKEFAQHSTNDNDGPAELSSTFAADLAPSSECSEEEMDPQLLQENC